MTSLLAAAVAAFEMMTCQITAALPPDYATPMVCQSLASVPLRSAVGNKTDFGLLGKQGWRIAQILIAPRPKGDGINRTYWIYLERLKPDGESK